MLQCCLPSAKTESCCEIMKVWQCHITNDHRKQLQLASPQLEAESWKRLGPGGCKYAAIVLNTGTQHLSANGTLSLLRNQSAMKMNVNH